MGPAPPERRAHRSHPAANTPNRSPMTPKRNQTTSVAHTTNKCSQARESRSPRHAGTDAAYVPRISQRPAPTWGVDRRSHAVRAGLVSALAPPTPYYSGVRRRPCLFRIGLLTLAATASGGIEALEAIAGPTPQAGAARVVDCRAPAPNTPWSDGSLHNIGKLSARNMACSAARATLTNGHLREGPGRYSTAGFHCIALKTFRAPGFITGQTIRCVAAGRAFRFDWAT